jgi:hypothetical protein
VKKTLDVARWFIDTRQAMVARLPVTGELLRGSLLERIVRHSRGCTICAGGGGHPINLTSPIRPI